MKYITAEELVAINQTVIRLSGGSHGLREPGMLESIALKLQTEFSGQELYPDIFLKAAVIYKALVNYRVFKIDIDLLVTKATQKLGEVTFQQKKHIVERVINKVIASPQEVIIWGQIPLTAFAGTGKVKYEPINRDCGITQRRQKHTI